MSDHGPRAFALDDAQTARAHAWCDAHRARHGPPAAAAGGRFAYTFTPTGLGTVAGVTCADCDERLDLTCYEDW